MDVGYGQFDWSLRTDPRVTLHERTNIRRVPEGSGPFDVIVGDLSFVSPCLAGTLANLAGTTAACVLLVKPQFEGRREEAGPGIVTDPKVWEGAIRSAIRALEDEGLGTTAVAASRLRGATGNQGFLLARPGAQTAVGAVAAALEAIA